MLGVLCLSLLIVFVGNSSLNVAIPTLSRELHATESQLQWVVASYSLVFAGPAVLHRRARRPLRTQGRAAVRPRRLPRGRRARVGVDRDVAADRVPRADGRGRRVHHAVDALDPRQRVPAARTHEGDRVLGRDHRRGRRDRAGRERLAARALLVRVGVPRERADHLARARARLLPRAEVEGSRSRPRSTRSARCSRSSGSRRSCTGSSRRPRNGWSSSPTLSAFGDRAHRARAVRGVGAARRRSRCSTCASSATPRSAPAPAA